MQKDSIPDGIVIISANAAAISKQISSMDLVDPETVPLPGQRAHQARVSPTRIELDHYELLLVDVGAARTGRGSE